MVKNQNLTYLPMHFFCWLFPHTPVWYVPGLQGALHSIEQIQIIYRYNTDTIQTDTVHSTEQIQIIM